MTTLPERQVYIHPYASDGKPPAEINVSLHTQKKVCDRHLAIRIAVFSDLLEGFETRTKISATVRPFQLTKAICEAQTIFIYIHYQLCIFSGCIFELNWPTMSKIYVILESDHYFCYELW